MHTNLASDPGNCTMMSFRITTSFET